MKFNTHHFPQGTIFRLNPEFGAAYRNGGGRREYMVQSLVRNGIKSWVIKTGVFEKFNDGTDHELAYNLSHVEAIIERGDGPVLIDEGWLGGPERQRLLEDIDRCDARSLLADELGLCIGSGWAATISPRSVVMWEVMRCMPGSDLVDFDRLMVAVFKHSWTRNIGVGFMTVTCFNRKRLRRFVRQNIGRFLLDLRKAHKEEEEENDRHYEQAMRDFDDLLDSKVEALDADKLLPKHQPTASDVNGLPEADAVSEVVAGRWIWDKAITRDAHPILILKGDTIIGKARWSASADGITSMQMTEGQALEIVEKLSADAGGELPAKWYNPWYFDFDGSYSPRANGWETLDAAFGDTRAVSEFGLHYGMVPDSFAGVEGYKSAFNRVLDEPVTTRIEVDDSKGPAVRRVRRVPISTPTTDQG